MRDPERLSSSNGISAFERELLDAGKKEAMPAALRDQMERALGFSGAMMPSAPVQARVEAATGIKASAMLWISAGVVVLGVVGGILGARLGTRLFPPHAVAPAAAPPPSAASVFSGAETAVAAVAENAPLAGAPARDGHRGGLSASPARRTLSQPGSGRSQVRGSTHSETSSGGRHHRGPAVTSSAKVVAPASASPPAETAASATAETAAEHPAPEPSTNAVAAPEPRPSSSRAAPHPVASSGDLRAEIDLIDGARAALRDGQTSRALDLLGDHAMHFPHGSLVPEETALRVEALMRLGRSAEARAYARRFVAANPGSPLAERVRRLVDGDLNP